jgi:glucokinase
MNMMAGEAGHVTIWPDGHACPCGSHGCLVQYASAPGVPRMAQEMIVKRGAPGHAALEKSNPSFSGVDVYELARAGDSDAAMILEIVGDGHSHRLGGSRQRPEPPPVFCGGRLGRRFGFFPPCCEPNFILAVMFTSLADGYTDAKGRRSPKTHVAPAELGSEAGILGACLLPFSIARDDLRAAGNGSRPSLLGAIDGLHKGQVTE